jgi:acetyltransferase-like isoleucine patch superfamily enzyme
MKTIIRNVFGRFYRKLNERAVEENDSIRQMQSFLEGLEGRYGSVFGDHSKAYSPFNITDSAIGSYTYIAKNASISLARIGKFCSIGPNFLCGWGIHPLNGISTAPMFYSNKKQNGISLSERDKIVERKLITIGNDVFVGANVVVLDGVSIGDGAVIGAGAVVSKDIPPYAIAVGCPIQIIGYRFNREQIDKLLRIRWWDFEQKDLQVVEKYFFEIDMFLNCFPD